MKSCRGGGGGRAWDGREEGDKGRWERVGLSV